MAKVVTVGCPAPEFLPDISALDGAITAKTKAIIINSPNNPTGVIIP
ncbi:MAG: aminotransferase class I/II-fold pyridoxal phosphate-dependent enzyme, partial [Bacteroidaceae bacterium]|nr:aminotransferase class I/II-fold pyridoxal phosphate-dependent enzyme [Bacteroidaceae bacterium]